MSPRLRALIVLAAIVPVGFALKFYSGPGQWWVNNWGASFVYEIFFILVGFIVFPRREAIATIAIAVCLATCALEFLQMWKPSWLESARGTFLGRSLLGNSFSWKDLPAYPLGCLLGWLVLRHLTEGEKTVE